MGVDTDIIIQLKEKFEIHIDKTFTYIETDNLRVYFFKCYMASMVDLIHFTTLDMVLCLSYSEEVNKNWEINFVGRYAYALSKWERNSLGFNINSKFDFANTDIVELIENATHDYNLTK